jgi:ABC-type multidrug transport system fused ATPase/permease subunit
VLILGTIRENMLFGNKDATEEEIKRTLEMASASFVETMEKGLDTYVGAASVMNLSGG